MFDFEDGLEGWTPFVEWEPADDPIDHSTTIVFDGETGSRCVLLEHDNRLTSTRHWIQRSFDVGGASEIELAWILSRVGSQGLGKRPFYGIARASQDDDQPIASGAFISLGTIGAIDGEGPPQRLSTTLAVDDSWAGQVVIGVGFAAGRPVHQQLCIDDITVTAR